MKEENDANNRELNDSKENGSRAREEVYTKIVRAGNRTYFLDVKATRKNDLYLTITESKKRFNKEGKFFYEKHKLFLYPEDFEKFSNGLEDVFSFIRNSETGDTVEQEGTTGIVENETEGPGEDDNQKKTDEFINVEFEDLGNK